MTDFYSVLRNALDRVGAVDDADARDRVYSHVRDGMVRRLQRQDPPVSEDVIAARIDDFEAAVARIEEEVAESAFAEVDFEPELHAPPQPPPQPQPRPQAQPQPQPEAAFAGDWPAAKPQEEREPAPSAAEAAAPESIWGAAAIDLAWNETTEQWQDPAAARPAQSRMPNGGWEERLGFALSEDRGKGRTVTEADFLDEAEWDDAEAPAAPAVSRRSRFSRLRGRRPAGPPAPSAVPAPPDEPAAAPPRRRWSIPIGRAKPAAAAAPAPEPQGRYAPLPDVDFGQPTEPQVRPRRLTERGAAERAVFYLEDRSLHADAAAIVAAAREARVIDVEFEEDDPEGHQQAYEPEPPPRASTRQRVYQPEYDDRDDEGYLDRPRRSRTGRIFTIAISVLALIVAVWCGYVFLPLLLSSDATEPEPATIVAQAPVPAAVQPGDAITLFDGEDPTVFEGGPDNPVRYETDDTGGFVRLASSSTGGFRAVVGPGVAELLGDHAVRVTMDIRAAPTRPSSSMRIGYLRGSRLLEWRTIGLGADFETAILEWDIPPGAGLTPDALIIEPGIPGDGTALDIRSLSIQVLD